MGSLTDFAKPQKPLAKKGIFPFKKRRKGTIAITAKMPGIPVAKKPRIVPALEETPEP